MDDSEKNDLPATTDSHKLPGLADGARADFAGQDQETEALAETRVSPPEDTSNIFVVGVGSSAGGLEAILELVKNLSGDIPAALVIVQHMSPQHRSLMTTIISHETGLKVVDVEDGMVPEKQTIYVTPPNHDVVLLDGRLRLQSPSPEIGAPKPSIDRFFISLAESLLERSVAIVLSGTGSDGSYGIKSIRSVGGITIAQDERSAKYDGMPIAAVETGCVDLILSPKEIAAHLERILLSTGELTSLDLIGSARDPMADLLQLLQVRTQVDFREYKPNTINRRIDRRMKALGIDNQMHYVDYCLANPVEVDALFRDLLISVTRFFRDPQEFLELKNTLRTIMSGGPDHGLRIWVAGCATGEEVYSLAIMVTEALGGTEYLSRRKVQIFATDLDEAALKIAREGYYSVAALDDVPSEYIDKYFHFRGEGVRVSSALREVVLFAKHNICKDPPFLNLDLICCRNLLIYFGSALRRRVLSRMHYALLPKGFLFLGAAESISSSDESFSRASGEAAIYQKRLHHEEYSQRSLQDGYAAPAGNVQRRAMTRLGREATASNDDHMFEGLARALGPNAVLVSNDLRIMKVFGDLSRFVTLKEERRLSLSVGMLRSPLDQEARTLVTLSLKSGEPRKGIVHRFDENSDMVMRMMAYPIAVPSLDERTALLTFNEWEERPTKQASESIPIERTPREVAEYIEKLENEVDSTREALQQTIEELETSNEELQSLNEELQSTNEELLATNEELETSNEELQSTNEELVTVNEELQVNSADLSTTTEEMAAILDNIGTAVLIVDTSMQITRASQEAIERLQIGSPVEGTHLSQIPPLHGKDSLAAICVASMQQGKKIVREIGEESPVVVRCSPHYDMRGRFRGASIVLIETTDAEVALGSEWAAPEFLPGIVGLDEGMHVLRLDPTAADIFGTAQTAAIGLPVVEFCDDAAEADRYQAEHRAFLDSDLRRDAGVWKLTPKGANRVRLIGVERWLVSAPNGKPARIDALHCDVTDLLVGEDDVTGELTAEALANLQHIGYWSYNVSAEELYWTRRAFALHGQNESASAPRLDAWPDFFDEAGAKELRQALSQAQKDGLAFKLNLQFADAVDRQGGLSLAARALLDASGSPIYLVGVCRKLD
ncbi:MAG: chemotaxis protein CheB [Pseudomonadota bacterium]